MWNRLKHIKKHLVAYISVSVLLAMITGKYFDTSFLKVCIVPVTILMIYPVMTGLAFKKLFSQCNVRLQLTIQIINFIVIPFLGYAVSQIFLKSSPLASFGLFLAAVLPTSGMTISWTSFAKGNIDVAVKTTMISLIAGAFVAPVYANFFMGTIVSVPLIQIIKKIIFIIFVPMILGYYTQKFAIHRYGQQYFIDEIKPKFPLISSTAVLMIIFIAVSMRAEVILAEPLIIIRLLLPILVFYTINYTLITAVGLLFFNRADSAALIFSTVMRNLSVALAISLSVFGSNGAEIALLIAAAYIIQIQSAAMYIKILDRIWLSKELRPESSFS